MHKFKVGICGSLTEMMSTSETYWVSARAGAVPKDKDKTIMNMKSTRYIDNNLIFMRGVPFIIPLAIIMFRNKDGAA